MVEGGQRGEGGGRRHESLLTVLFVFFSSLSSLLAVCLLVFSSLFLSWRQAPRVNFKKET